MSNQVVAKCIVKRFYVVIFTMVALTVIGHAQVNSKDRRTAKTMALIPEGSFTMGSNAGPDDEKPEHTIFLKAFYLDILPVTNSDFAQFLNSQGLKNQRGETFYDDDDGDEGVFF